MKRTTHVADEQLTTSGLTHDQIAQRAHEIFLARGASDGQDVEDWLCAEAELQATAGKAQLAQGTAGVLCRARKAEAMDDLLYSSLCRRMRALCLGVQARQSTWGPLLVEWQSWGKGFVAGLYYRKSAERAALSAGWEAALLEMDDPEAGQFGHAAADLAWAAVHAAEGERGQAEALARAARQRLAALLVSARDQAWDGSLDQGAPTRTPVPRVAAEER